MSTPPDVNRLVLDLPPAVQEIALQLVLAILTRYLIKANEAVLLADLHALKDFVGDWLETPLADASPVPEYWKGG